MDAKGLFCNSPDMDFPLEGRGHKPRNVGLTMVMDKGLGLSATADLLQLAAPYIDYMKLGFGTAALYTSELLKAKLSTIRSCDVKVYPGGTFLEIAYLQNKVDNYLAYAQEMGFDCIEVSDGTIAMERVHREEIIGKAQACGFQVITEVGKKDPRDQVSNRVLVDQIKRDLDAGAAYVIVEGRETGLGIGMFDGNGEIKKQVLNELLDGIDQPQKVIWEAPLKKQQVELIYLFGSNVNLGNIASTEIIALEALRRGLRGDTLRFVAH